MHRPTVASIVFLLVLPLQAANWPERPTLHAVRVTTPPVVDGDLSDEAWRLAPAFTDFTQHDPHDGEPATLRTSFRVVYDDEAIYFGAMMEDSAPPNAQLGRRDTFGNYDFLSINLDPQHDRVSGAAFTVTPSNMQIDSVLYNDIGEDLSWDAVWDSHARVVPGGWVAEVRVPFSQLRFPDKPVHTWGINVTRRTTRINEWARVVNTRKGETGFVSHFADLVGIEGIRRGRPLELVPYSVLRSDFRSGFDRSNPFLDTSRQHGAAGLDLKYALTSSLTLTGTINPDFGQVEVDPAVVNLSEFETFYPEKRPFFTEGLDVFRFGDSPARSRFSFMFTPQVFYSRRIGRVPQGFVDAEFTSGPSETTILGAAKISGTLGNGWTVGVLDALTQAEHALFADGPTRGREPVEPMTNYFVSRATKTTGPGSRVGFLLTSVNRRNPAELAYLRDHAVTAGVDGYNSFAGRSWIFEWFGAGTRVGGSEQSIALTQTSSARYYNRPDASHVDFDPSRTSLSGLAGRAMLAKQTGRWRPNVHVQAYSPGFETNDVGFLQRTDMISAHALVQYVNETITSRFRERQLLFGTWANRNFDGDTLDRGVFADHRARLANYWEYGVKVFVAPPGFSDRLARGGPLMRRPASWTLETGLETDSRKRVSYELASYVEGAEDGSYDRSVAVGVAARPRSNLSLSVAPSVRRARDRAAYAATLPDPSATATFGRRWVFADLDQRELEVAMRVDWTVHSRLSFQLYMQPFIASGDYSNLRALAAPRTRRLEPFAGAVTEPDFNFRSVRGSAVARWEFRPGSALFVAWNENRAEVVPRGDFRPGRDLRAIPGAPSHDVLMVKVSYWFGM